MHGLYRNADWLRLCQANAIPFLSNDIRQRLGTVAISPTSALPKVAIAGTPIGKPTSAALGASAGYTVGSVIWALQSIGCLFAPPSCLPAMGPFVVGGAIIGASIAGATAEAKTPYSDAKKAAESATPLSAQQVLAEEITAVVGKIDSVTVVSSPKDAEMVIEVGIDKVEIDKFGYLSISGEALISASAPPKIVKTYPFQFAFLESRTLKEWSHDSGREFVEAILRGLVPIGKRVGEELFLLERFPVRLKTTAWNASTKTLSWSTIDEQPTTQSPYHVELWVVPESENDICVNWIARDQGSPNLNLEPPCLLDASVTPMYTAIVPGSVQQHNIAVKLDYCADYRWSIRAVEGSQSKRVDEWATWTRFKTTCERNHAK